VSICVVFDTNIRISAVIFKGKPLEVMGRVRPPEFQQIVSPALLDELRDILSRKFDWPESAISTELETSTKTAYASFLTPP